MQIGDRVSCDGKRGVICRDRMNGMYDIALDYQGVRPKVGQGQYLCGGTMSCIYEDEMQLITVEENCLKCKSKICEGDGRYRLLDQTAICLDCSSRMTSKELAEII